MFRNNITKHGSIALVAGAMVAIPLVPALTSSTVIERVYTTDADFNEGSFNNVAPGAQGEIQLDRKTGPFNFLWVTLWNQGTIVKIDTETGKVMGEYLTAPVVASPRTTAVDLRGDVWVESHEWADGRWNGSVTHIGLAEHGQCVDRNGDGFIRTSTGLGDVLPWTDIEGGAGTSPMTRSEDECVLSYTPVLTGMPLDHVSIDPDNNVWVGSTAGSFTKIDGRSGRIMQTVQGFEVGGLGGLIDGSGVLWSASPSGLLRWNPESGDPIGYGQYPSYQLCIDGMDNLWSTNFYDNTIDKLSLEGKALGSFDHGGEHGQGCVADRNNDIWVGHADALGGFSVGHLRNDGKLLDVIPLSSGPTNVALDAEGMIWATNYHRYEVARINPSSGELLSTVYVGDTSNSFGDITGSMLQSRPMAGTWTVVFDSGVEGAKWNKVMWTAEVFDEDDVKVSAASSADGISFGPAQIVKNRKALEIEDGRFIKVSAILSRDAGGMTPVLKDLTIRAIK